MTESSDAEILCEFMEARPKVPLHWPGLETSEGGWWALHVTADGEMQWKPARGGSLDDLHTVEAKIMVQSTPQPAGCADWGDAIDTAICDVMGDGDHWHFHASAETKLKALAAVLRGAGAAH